ncbi:MAG: beta-galactosidase [Bacteroidales bacterium]|nr:beta-galactosidase [Bacteroidales bacterium]
MKYFFWLILVVFLTNGIQAQSRLDFTINSNWHFYKGKADPSSNSIPWESVNLPHSWNVDDVMDDVVGYYRDTASYKKDLYIPAGWKDKEVFLVFDAIGISANIYINGKLAGSHIGAYTSFNVPISEYLDFSEEGQSKNLLFVQANNSYSDDIPPLSADFTFFGGIYRDVHLVALEKVHFEMDSFNSGGVIWTTPEVSNESAEVQIRGAFSNSFDKKKKVSIEHILIDNRGKDVLSYEEEHSAKSGEVIPFNCQMNLKKPNLWSPENPYLYRLVSRLKIDGKIIDEIENPLGFRWFDFDVENGFSLNGMPYKLIGASRHQDFPDMGNALEDEIHIRDIELLKEMGGNFLRIAHYPQDEAILQACDRLGILTSIEIPLVNRITESEAFFNNSELMLREMMAQYYNHPSLIIWAYMNEIFLKVPYENGTEELENYLRSTNQLFSRLENIIRENDPYRYTMMVGHGSGQIYKDAGLIDIPQVFGWNIYTGWYDGKSSSIGSSFDKKHLLCGDVPILITEYGADADIRIHNFKPDRFDKSVEYATDYHIEYIKAFNDRKYLNAMIIWNLADFNSETRTETTPHINAKGLLTHDRKPKDPYRFYKANFGKEPYIRIGSNEWNFRTDRAKNETDEFVVQPVQVFSNFKEVELLHNGTFLAKEDVVNGLATFRVAFKQGANQLVAKAGSDESEIYDLANIDFTIIPTKLKDEVFPFEKLNISLGDKRFYTDYLRHENWLPAKKYSPESWGYIGGDVYKMVSTKRQSYGSDINILDTDLDAVYATQIEGIEEFRFDVPDGKYSLTLHFAELYSDVEHEVLVYNLGDEDDSSKQSQERTFSVKLNDKEFLTQLSNQRQLVPEKAISFKTEIIVENGEGVSVKFVSLQGEAILNGIQLRRIY